MCVGHTVFISYSIFVVVLVVVVAIADLFCRIVLACHQPPIGCVWCGAAQPATHAILFTVASIAGRVFSLFSCYGQPAASVVYFIYFFSIRYLFCKVIAAPPLPLHSTHSLIFNIHAYRDCLNSHFEKFPLSGIMGQINVPRTLAQKKNPGRVKWETWFMSNHFWVFSRLYFAAIMIISNSLPGVVSDRTQPLASVMRIVCLWFLGMCKCACVLPLSAALCANRDEYYYSCQTACVRCAESNILLCNCNAWKQQQQQQYPYFGGECFMNGG